MRKLIIVILGFLFFSCKQNSSISINHRDNADIELKRKILEKGDIEAYQDLGIKLLDEDKAYLLSYSLVMANKYDYSKAYYDVFEILMTSNGCSVDYDLSCLDDLTKNMMLKYLRKAIEKGDKTASKILLDYYDKDKSYPIEELYRNVELINKAKMNIK